MIFFMTVCTLLVMGFAINGLASLIGSNFLSLFLDQNLILLLVALFAINTTTASVILTKMREIADKHPNVDFQTTRKEMKTSSFEQVALILLAVLIGVLKSSPWMADHIPHLEFILNSVLVGIFFYAVHILYDTAKGVYVILDHGH
ncbi:MAG: hypothetical protein WC334_05905 [Kiritimatiellales bacterium]|jgi:hypothetical protein